MLLHIRVHFHMGSFYAICLETEREKTGLGVVGFNRGHSYSHPVTAEQSSLFLTSQVFKFGGLGEPRRKNVMCCNG